MSESNRTTDRRAFLKGGAVVAAPLAMAAPAAALADDGSRARLARVEDERAVEALQRKFLRHVNGAGDCGEFLLSSDAVDLGEGLRAIAEDLHHDATLELSADGLSARTRCACRVERETAFTGQTTLERMARFEGHGSHRHEEHRVLAMDYIKREQGWRIAGARFA